MPSRSTLRRTQDNKDAPPRLRALATTVYRGLSDEFDCRYLRNGIWSVRSIDRRTGGITLSDPRIVDVIGDTCTCEGFAHMHICKHLIAALRRSGMHGVVDNTGLEGVYAIKRNGILLTERHGERHAIVVFINMDDALRMERADTDVIVALDAQILDRGYSGICMVVGKYSIIVWNDGDQ